MKIAHASTVANSPVALTLFIAFAVSVGCSDSDTPSAAGEASEPVGEERTEATSAEAAEPEPEPSEPVELGEPRTPEEVGLTISRETTWFTEPLDEHGWPDYFAALNAEMGEGVEPEDNIAAGLAELLGDEFTFGSERLIRALGLDPAEMPEPVLTFDNGVGRALRGGNPLEDPAVKQWLEEHDAALDRAVTIIQRRPHFHFPIVPSSDAEPAILMDSLASHLSAVNLLNHALVTRAEARANEGDFEAAWRDVRASHRLAQRLASGGPAIQTMTGAGSVGTILNVWHSVIGESGLTGDELREHRRRVESLPEMKGVAAAIEVERAFALDTMALIAKYPELFSGYPQRHELYNRLMAFRGQASVRVTPEDAKLADWSRLFRLVNGEYDRLIAVAQADASARPDLVAEHSAPAPANGEDSAIQQFILNDLVMQDAATVARIANEIDQTRAHQGMVALSLAVQAYEAEQGELPADLAAIVPDYLDAIPIDPFDDEPLRYAQRENGGFKIWSVGRDRTDDGGLRMRSPSPAEPRGDVVLVVD